MIETIIKGAPVLFTWALRIAPVLIITVLGIMAGLEATNRKRRGK